jgi:hypothetical protein
VNVVFVPLPEIEARSPCPQQIASLMNYKGWVIVKFWVRNNSILTPKPWPSLANRWFGRNAWCSRTICMHAPHLITELYNFAPRNDGLIMLLPRASLHLLLPFKFPSCFTWRGALYECLYINYAKQASIILEIKLGDSAWRRRIRFVFLCRTNPIFFKYANFHFSFLPLYSIT